MFQSDVRSCNAGAQANSRKHKLLPILVSGAAVIPGLVLVCGWLILGKSTLELDLGINWAFLHPWLRDGNVHPGRMPPSTAIGLLLAGASLVMLTRIASKAQQRWLQILVCCVAVIGLTGLVGYAIEPGTATLVCLPSGRQQANHTFSRINIAGLPLPMNHAVDGRQGLAATFDDKGINVMAAYAPLAPNLALVVKQDTEELYSAVCTQLKVVVPVLLLVLLGAVMLMRRQLRPLMASLVSAERKANDKQMEINALLASVGEGIMMMDERGTIESFNPAAATMFGYAPDEVLGKRMLMLIPPEVRQSLKNGMRNGLRNDPATGEAHLIGKPNMELPGLRKDGSRFTLELTVKKIGCDTRRAFVAIVRDISERKQVEEKLLYLAQTDALTNLPNRALFMDRLAGATLRANRAKGALAVLFLDLDGFKKVNDTLGHHSGDQLLKKFGERLSQAVRKSDTVARLAGDEFTIILEQLSDPEADTRAVADKIIAAMHHPFELADGSVSVTTSIGITVHSGKALANVTELLRRADDAMYRAKFSGKNRWSN